MTVIYIDADACPVREEIYRVAARLGVAVHVVSNGSRPIRAPGLPNVQMVVVSTGPDAADDWIAERITPADVCATADIPLAARCLAAGARALAWKGQEWTKDNIGGALAGRALNQHLRETGVDTGGPSALTQRDRAAFLNTLDRLVQAARRGAPPSISLRAPDAG
ncbi:MAG: YaiI/YqxD family protein [Proteobacteria bacterium]|nr:YaiI/YqxD family protein [Pseudomonadota bacterium]